MPPIVSVIILHYRTGNLLKECLRTFFSLETSLAMEVIVVDNDSRDGTMAMVRDLFPSVRCIDAEWNRGYAGGNNLGIAAAKGKYIFVMNSDIVVRPGALEQLVARLEQDPKIGMIGPQLRNPDGSVQDSCYRFHTLATPLYRRTFVGKLPFATRALSLFLMHDVDRSSSLDVDWLLGGAVLVRASAMQDVGLLDDGFFLYFDDTDWCRRFWEKGWRVTYEPAAQMIHFHQRASRGGILALVNNPTARIHVRSAVRYFRKYAGTPHPRGQAGA